MLTFPLAASDFFDIMPISAMNFRLGVNTTMTESEDGERYAHERGERLWYGELQLDIGTADEGRQVAARLQLIEEAGGSFFVYDARARGPQADPMGAALSGFAPRLSGIDASRRSVSIDQLPAGYIITTGDYLGFSYGANPTRHAVHQVAGVTRLASGSGEVTELQVVPKIREGANVGTSVQLVQPVCKAQLEEADYGKGGKIIAQGGVLRWSQTLR